MSVDWNEAPEGAVAHVRRVAFGALVCHWLMAKNTGDWVDTNAVLAPDFGLSAGVTIRPSAAEADLRRITYDYCIESDWIEDDKSDNRLPIERRLQAMVDQLKAQSAREAELRAEVALHKGECERLNDAVASLLSDIVDIKKRNNELAAERDQLRDELERARAMKPEPEDWPTREMLDEISAATSPGQQP